MAKKRLFELAETKGTFECKGIINGTKKQDFYTDKRTKNNKEFRAVNFGCEYDSKKTIFMRLNGMPKESVYFSKYNKEEKKSVTKPVDWAERNTFKEEGWSPIGVRLGLVKVADENGKLVNDKKSMVEFDACKYINENLQDDVSVYIRGNVEFDSFVDNQGTTRRSTKYVPQQISLCQDVDFEEFEGGLSSPVNNFTQTIVYTGIEKEVVDEKETGRFVVSAYIVTYSNVIATEFIITNPTLASTFRKQLKPYTAIQVFGDIEVTYTVEEVEQDDIWGEPNKMNAVKGKSKTEMVIKGANKDSIDKEGYTEEKINEALRAIRNAQTAEQNFGTTSNVSFDSDDDTDDLWD